MSQRLGMADGRCFTVNSSSQLYNNYLMKMNGVSYEDNYSYRKLLQTKGPALFKREKPDERCASCDKPLVDTRGIYEIRKISFILLYYLSRECTSVPYVSMR